MEESETFSDVHGMIGNFHLTKVGLKCSGRYLRGSGIDEVLTENKIFGKLVLNQALEGTHYVRALYCVLLVSDLISSLAFCAFHDWLNIACDSDLSSDILERANNVRELFSQKQRCPNKSYELGSICNPLYNEFDLFIKECTAKSEVCQYL